MPHTVIGALYMLAMLLFYYISCVNLVEDMKIYNDSWCERVIALCFAISATILEYGLNVHSMLEDTKIIDLIEREDVYQDLLVKDKVEILIENSAIFKEPMADKDNVNEILEEQTIVNYREPVIN